MNARSINFELDGLHARARRIPGIARLVITALISTSILYSYTVLTHEAIIDSVWDASLKGLLLKRYPNATPEQLEQAHAYAYGGCIIQDMGYYPFSNRFFSDLTHYVRSGDFVAALIRESTDLNEYAFALGALEHFVADTEGHRIATNHAVPILYPELRRKYGNDVTYWDDPVAHVRTEFGFDVLQVAWGRYAPDGYRKFIGFQVARASLERAFLDTYGIELKDVFGNISLALGTYRYTVRSIIPGMTRIAWSLKREAIRKEIPDMTRKKFLYNLSRSSYEKEWGKEYHKPGLGTKMLTCLFRMLPSRGSMNALRIRTPTPAVEKLFMASFNATVDSYKATLAALDAGKATELPNRNLDASLATTSGKYLGADKAYAQLLNKLAERQFAGLSPDLRRDILAYYEDLKAPAATRATPKSKTEYARLRNDLEQLKSLSPAEPARTAPRRPL